MSINANDTSSTTGTPATSGPTPVLTAYEQLVANLNNAIDALVAQIPEFQVPHPTNTKFVRSHQNVPLEFSVSALAAVNDSPALQASNTLDVNEAREALQFISAFQQLYEKVTLLSQNLKFTIMERRAQVSVKSQMVYGVAKQLVRDPNSNIAGHVKIMKEHLAKGKRKSTKKSPAPGSGTVKAPVTTTTPAPGSGTVKAPVTTTTPAPGSGTVTPPVTTTAPAPVAQPHATSQQEGGGSKQ
jgi:hypothetical protein